MDEFSTPMMKQYNEIKQQYKDCLLFYRMGDFYELFLDDAIVGSKILDITLTGKSNGKNERIPMAGVPYHAVDAYVAKLVKAGYKVAICEQVSEPGVTKLVDREVIRIVTPGTVLDEKTLDKSENNYIIALTSDNNSLGIAYADISTGYFVAQQLETDNILATILNECSRINPVECILSEKLYNSPEILRTIKVLKNCNIYCFYEWDQFSQSADNYLKNHFKIKSLEIFNINNKSKACEASAALLAYLKNTQKDKVYHFRKIATVSDDEYVSLDRSTLVNLEIFNTIRNGDHKGALVEVLDNTQTAMGSRLLKNWLRKPLVSKNNIDLRLEAVDFYTNKQEKLIELREELKNIVDMERITARLSVGTGNARDMISLKNSLQHAIKIKKKTENVPTHRISFLANQITSDVQSIIDEIETKILDEPSFDPKTGGIVKDNVNQTLDLLRKKVNRGKDWITELETKERERTGINSLKIRFNKIFGFYIEVSKSNINAVPNDYMRKQTLVNGERFITPDLKKQEEIILEAEEKLNDLEYEIYKEVLNYILDRVSTIQEAAQAVAELDVLSNFAHIAIKNKYIKPTLTVNSLIHIQKGRHPVVEKIIQDQFVPNDVVLDRQNNQLWIITGPNMAGKSVFIRQVAIISLMAQIGSFVPAEKAELAIVDKIFVRSGASDVISEGLSTFMVEMIETAQILAQATEKSLIVMDEIGRGTSTYDGISIATAVAEYIVQKLKTKTLFATHYHELQNLEEKYLNEIKNYHMSVHQENGDVVFLHTIKKGGASHSLGISVAKLAGLPEEVVTNAYTNLETLEQERVEKISTQTTTQLKLSFEEENPITAELHQLDIHQMTPLQALNKLAELKNKVKLIQAVTPKEFIHAD